MNIGKKDVRWGYLSLFLVQGINALLLPFVLFFLTSNELGLWYTFTSLYGMAMLIDFGFQSTLTRHVSYVWSGSNAIQSEGFNVVKKEGNWNNEYFIKLLSTIKSIYYSMGLIIFIILASIGTIYIYIISKNEVELKVVFISWFIYMFAIILNISFSFWNAMLKGIGAIKNYNQTLIIAKGSQFILSIALLLMGYGIIGVAIAYLVSVIINRVVLSKLFYNFHKRTQYIKGKVRAKFNKEIFRRVLPNTLKTGIVSLSNFLILNFPVLLASYFLSLKVSGEFGLTSQLITLIITISNSYFNTYLAKFNYHRVRDEITNLIKLFRKSLIINYSLNFTMFIFLILVGNHILNLISQDNDLLPICLMIIIMVYRFLYNNQTIFVSLLSTKNIVPYYKSFLISAVLTVLIQIVLLEMYENIYSIILPILFIQLLFNNWYWPLQVKKDFRR